MPRPRYPTKEGIWSRGRRPDDGYSGVRLGTPYPEAVEQFRKAVQGREDFDPAVLFVWGTMQATAVLEILKAVEEAFGEEGQQVVRKAINRAGYEAMEGFLDNSVIPDELEGIKRLSFAVTGINTILYASLERPWVVSEDQCEFDILWCPHQDRYTAFDCRVQRYFVEGMIQAAQERGFGRFTARVEELIPKGADRCHFVVKRLAEDSGRNPWLCYSDELGRKALKRVRKGSDR